MKFSSPTGRKTRKFLVVSFLFYLLQTNNIRQRWARTRGQNDAVLSN